MTFNEAVERVIGHKGVFSTDHFDDGNWTGGAYGKGEFKGTKYGISAKVYPKFDIANLTKDEAKAIYLRDYWNKIIIQEMPDAIHFAMFDMAVNMGLKAARQILQRALGVNDDGIIGPVTKARLQTVNPNTLANRISAMRLLMYTEFPGWRSNGKGWARRVLNNMLMDNPL